MRLTYIVTALIILCAAAIGGLMITGPKLGLQLPPIEKKAMAYLEQHKLISHDEHLTGYKAISLYDYSHAAVMTDKRIFLYKNDKVLSIPLDKITLVSIKDAELGRQEVLISAQMNGMIALELPHTSVPELLKILKVPGSIVKHNGPMNEEQTAPKVHTNVIPGSTTLPHVHTNIIPNSGTTPPHVHTNVIPNSVPANQQTPGQI